MKKLTVLLLAFLCSTFIFGQAEMKTYLNDIKVELNKKWPNNRTINIVYHGHSVPTGYSTGGVVNTFDAYPRLATKLMKEIYPYAVLNTITTSIGGERATQGVLRFEDEVLTMRPDVLFIDYALNDRNTPLPEVKVAWESMVDMALAKGLKVILFTPTPDTHEDILSDDAPLAAHAAQIREIAKDKGVGLIDSYQMFKDMVAGGTALAPYMAQANHINKLGHEKVAALIFEWFAPQDKEATAHFTFDEQKTEGIAEVVYANDDVMKATLTKAEVVNDADRGYVLELESDSGLAQLSQNPIGTGSFSFSFWYNSQDERLWKNAFTFTETQGRDLLGLTNEGWSGNNSFCFYRKTVKDFASSKKKLLKDEWHHIVFVAANGSAQYYLDGQLTQSLNFTLSGYNFTDFYLGSNSGVTNGCKIDDLMFFQDALTLTNVKDIYAEQKNGNPVEETNVEELSALVNYETSINNKVLTIVPQNTFNWEDSICRIYSVNGQQVKEQNVSQSLDVDCSHLEDGVYVLHLGKEGKTFLLK